MSIATYRLQTAAFPNDYAEILVESLTITPASFLSVKDTLYHFRYLDECQAAEVMRQIVEIVEATRAPRGNDRVSGTHTPTTPGDLGTPWSLRFERDGTEDVAVIRDADDEEVVRSRHFWMPEKDDPVPSTLTAMRLIAAAPKPLTACRMVVARWEHGDLAEAARACHSAVELGTADSPPWAIIEILPDSGTPYSVLLLYPDYANDSGTETFYAFVAASDSLDAVAQARRQAAEAQEGIDIEPDDFAPLLVTKGHQYGEPLFNK